nr:adhesion G protein-coupled receptor F5 isoform X2 [Syngnathus scovelli]XP_049612742.1 adhesion G protein-coupled receptor F5 isoform X3 [Syngnathus scovelli]XP_049612743.1 adhesion G protein-coupled receptor F5 isoform X4 [Syngnathus scovelli]XP_049612744.1 adhesion G protein-coupled receptor F5 isoform X5 [Syngnathus scovelli]XP_049612746.1 adhesion G protein-coupled receptor F5 isoform X6 [Syngnathus scovelli]XP_049612747.1 adhesion G protein-coupled receptor F5 isoform X7 [Syngnathus sco
MTILKALRFIILFLSAHVFRENESYTQLTDLVLQQDIFQDVTDRQLSHKHVREKRVESFPTVTVVILLDIPNDPEPTEFTNLLRDAVGDVILPFNITDDFLLTSINLTTACIPNSSGGQQCHCEDDLLWSEEICDTFGACSNASTENCNCINGIPIGHVCEPSIILQHPTEVNIVITVDIPTITESSELINLLRDAVDNLSLPLNITDEIELQSWNLTTACPLNATGGPECQCEESFGWSCDICLTDGGCSDASPLACDCRYGVPPLGESCKPISSIAPCPPPIEVDIVLIVDTPTNAEPSEIWNQLRDALKNISFPLAIAEELELQSWNLTTACYTDLNQQQQCQCENDYGWSCEICKEFGACSNDSMQNCDCINKIPSDGLYCELNVITMCSTTTPPLSTTNTTSAISPTSATATTPPPSRTNTTLAISPTSATTATTATTTQNRSLSFIMEFDFVNSFNDPNNSVNKRCLQSIETQSVIHIPGLISVRDLVFRAGSTIADFEILASMTIQDPDVEALLRAIFRDLKNTFPLRFDSRRILKFQPITVFFEDESNITCGPPPNELQLRITSTKWTLNGVSIIEDARHRFSQANGAETLTITNTTFTDNGQYECRLFDGNSSYRQVSNETFSVLEKPIIQTIPLQNTTILCVSGQQVSVQCSVQDPYQVMFLDLPNSATGPIIQQQIMITQENCDNQELVITCQVTVFPQFTRNISLVFVPEDEFTCVGDPEFGNGFLNETRTAPCEAGEVGVKTAVCRESGQWEDREDNCTSRSLADLLIQSESLDNQTLPEFLEELRITIIEQSDQVDASVENISTTVTILSNVATLVTTADIAISRESMKNVLLVTDVLIRDQARESWDILNFEAVQESEETRIITPRNESTSSVFLFSIEGITSRLINASLVIETPLILLNKTTFIDSFNGDFNSTVEIDIEGSNGATNLTVVTFESLDNALPPRDENNATGRVINGRIVLVQSDTIVDNITFTYDIVDDDLGNPQCVFWNFSLFDGLGGWDGEGCELIEREDETVTCRCDHLTSFSILMSPVDLNSRVLDFITYIGVGISMASLVICLFIEAFIWKKVRKSSTSHLRHVSIVNIALSLLIANIWFIIGASISEGDKTNPDACTAATFFIHFFYLALFFWMLASALLLLYRSVRVLGGGLSKNAMLAIGYSLGYGAPLIITVITIAVTAPSNAYIRENVICWLNWQRSRALLAFVIPALIIVFINILILIVVIVKILQSRGMSSTQPEEEKYVLVVIIRSLAVLTPFFGLTWSLGVGILIDPSNLGIHIAFAFFNSLQGFFILVFGTLLDRKVRSEISTFRLSKSQSSGSGTRTTSASSSGWQIFRNFGRRGGNGLSESSSYSAINT